MAEQNKASSDTDLMFQFYLPTLCKISFIEKVHLLSPLNYLFSHVFIFSCCTFPTSYWLNSSSYLHHNSNGPTEFWIKPNFALTMYKCTAILLHTLRNCAT